MEFQSMLIKHTRITFIIAVVSCTQAICLVPGKQYNLYLHERLALKSLKSIYSLLLFQPLMYYYYKFYGVGP